MNYRTEAEKKTAKAEALIASFKTLAEMHEDAARCPYRMACPENGGKPDRYELGMAQGYRDAAVRLKKALGIPLSGI